MERETMGVVTKETEAVMAGGMTLDEAIKSRRSIGRVLQTAVPRHLIEEIIEAACWAPSHYNTQPWRFIVMTGEGRSLLGKGYANVAAAMNPELSGEQLEERQAKEHMKAKRAPVIIAAVCSPSADPRASFKEELAAAHASVQNLLLAAHAKGLGAIWRSGEPMYHDAMKETFQLTDEEQLIALIYLGYSDMPDKTSTRKAIQEVTSWVD